jgi:hypothetical protein
MNNIKIYYIPENLNIKNGPIYTLYINKNNNLDLSSIIEEEKNFNNITVPFKENKIIIEEKDYNKLININTKILSNLTELNNLNNEYHSLLTSLIGERKI